MGVGRGVQAPPGGAGPGCHGPGGGRPASGRAVITGRFSGARVRQFAQDVEAGFADPGAQGGVGDALAGGGGQAQDADLADVAVLLDRARGLADLRQRVDRGQRRHDVPEREQAVQFPLLLEVGGVAADDALQLHPQVAVVVGVVVARAGPAGHHRAAAAHHEDRDPEGGPAHVLEDDVRVLPHPFADEAPEPLARLDDRPRVVPGAVVEPDLLTVYHHVAAEPRTHPEPFHLPQPHTGEDAHHHARSPDVTKHY
ncbi:hypothetical protein ACH49_09170 [Streptomyces leeuwenhoekii]|uniref:Uncharacterized protein n=1 Tax=Streptomyces leeuwenhoekii TaxID=1437453 RepID=A0ABR5I1L2_STRLW|nr:hypothetical protein ACH49_09170 [Streptomyces leeuwenhoekii]